VRLNRWRVGLARLLLNGTGCKVAREKELVDVRVLVDEAMTYIERSGALASPPRVRAQRRLMRVGGELAGLVGRLEANA